MELPLSCVTSLALDEVAGLITEEEKEYLYWVIEQNPRAKAEWQRIQDMAPKLLEEAEECMRVNPPEPFFEILTQGIQRKTAVNILFDNR